MNMKRFLIGAILVSWAIAFPLPTLTAGVDVRIGISLPPPIVFGAPPAVIVLPETDDVYVVPEVEEEIFFWNGWWWRPWEGGWYRSHYYDRGWVYFNHVPRFYFDVDPGWRVFYRDRVWYGHPWGYQPIPHGDLQRNWRSWHTNRYWERHGAWGVEHYQPRSVRQRQDLRHQRQEQYRSRPEVQRHQEQMRLHGRQPRGRGTQKGPKHPGTSSPQEPRRGHEGGGRGRGM